MYQRSTEGTTGYAVIEREKRGGRAKLLRGREIIHNIDINKILMKKKNSIKLG